MFIKTLFIVAKTWKQPRCPSVGEWMDKLLQFQTMDYSPMLKRNELSSQKNPWKKLKCIMPNERNQSEKAIYCMIPTM